MRDQLLELIRNDNKNKNSNATKLNQPDKTSRETDTMAKYVNLNRFVLFSGYSRLKKQLSTITQKRVSVPRINDGLSGCTVLHGQKKNISI